MSTVLVAGATGAIGQKTVLALASRGDDVAKVYAFTRRDSAVKNALPAELRDRVTEVFLTGNNADDFARFPTDVDAVFCCVGTTIKAAGSEERFRAVDHTFVSDLAHAAKAKGVRYFALVSSVGADAASSNLYIRTKGETEAIVRGLGFEQALLVRPGVLSGASRPDSRPGECIANCCLSVITFCCSCGILGRVMPIDVATVAKFMELDWVGHRNNSDSSGLVRRRIVSYCSSYEKSRVPLLSLHFCLSYCAFCCLIMSEYEPNTCHSFNLVVVFPLYICYSAPRPMRLLAAVTTASRS